MRPIYSSPRHENIDRVVALFAEHGIETRVSNRAVYKRPSYSRFSYSAKTDSSGWPRVEVVHAADLTRARALLRDTGIDPLTRHAEVLAASREIGGDRSKRSAVVMRVRIALFAAIAILLVLTALKVI